MFKIDTFFLSLLWDLYGTVCCVVTQKYWDLYMCMPGSQYVKYSHLTISVLLSTSL